MSKFSKKEIKALDLSEKDVAKTKRKPINFNLYLSLVVMFGAIVGLCLFIKLQEFSVTITFPPVFVAFVVAVVGLSALYVVFKEVRK